MFFYLSKVFWFFIQPLNLTIFLLLAGLIAGLIGRRRLAVSGSVLAFLILALSTWTSIGAMMLNPLEERFPRQLINCGGPTIIPALRALAAVRARAVMTTESS